MATIEIPEFWTFRLACSCPFGSLVADQSPHAVIATEEQAWDDFYDGEKAKRRRDAKAGVYVTPSAGFDVDRWKAGHDHPDCTREGVVASTPEGTTPNA